MTLKTSRNRRFAHTLCSHTLSVAWDRTRPELGTLDIYAQEIIPDGGEDWPMVVYLQGGPGFAAPRFFGTESWLGRLLQSHRVLLVDQRGTGNSSTMLTDVPSPDPERFALLRASEIVVDCEEFRNALGIERWSLFGQSFGGFCITTYLSMFPDAIEYAYLTGGLPALGVHADEVYRATYRATQRRQEAFYHQFPWAEQRIREICYHLEQSDERLPTGERLSARRFRTIGIELGRGSGFDTLAQLLEQPWYQVHGEKCLRENFLANVGQRVSFAGHPLYAVIHESIYGGTVPGATNWSAHRIREEVPGFAEQADPRNVHEPFFLTAEHVFPWQFEEDPALLPYAEAAHALALKDDWNSLYNVENIYQTSAICAAAVYYDDIFVPMDLSIRTAEVFRDIRLHITNQYQHDGIRVDGGTIANVLLTKVNEY